MALEVERPGTGPHRFEALVSGVAVLAQSLEALAAGAHRVDLGLVVAAGKDSKMPSRSLLGFTRA